MSAPTTVEPVAWMYQENLDEFLNREKSSTAWSLKVGNPFRGVTAPLYSQATVDALQERIDELTHASHEPCDVEHLHDLIDGVRFTAQGRLYEQIAARNAIVKNYVLHDQALRARIDELEGRIFITNAALRAEVRK